MLPNLCVVVPCYNEARRLDRRAFLDYLAASPAALRFLFVNDGSQDDTLAALHELCRADTQRLAVLNLERNQGKAEAVRLGLLSAVQQGASLVAYWDADLATPLAAIEPFRDVFCRRKEIDIVAGIRMPLLGHTIERKPLRRLIGRGFARCASAALQLALYDTQCGAKMFRAGEALRSALAEPFQSRWIFDVELLVRWRLFLRQSGDSLAARTFEMPLEAWRDVPGSHLRPRDFVRAIGELAAIYRRYVLGRWKPPSVEAAPKVIPLPTRSVEERRAA